MSPRRTDYEPEDLDDDPFFPPPCWTQHWELIEELSASTLPGKTLRRTRLIRVAVGGVRRTCPPKPGL